MAFKASHPKEARVISGNPWPSAHLHDLDPKKARAHPEQAVEDEVERQILLRLLLIERVLLDLMR